MRLTPNKMESTSLPYCPATRQAEGNFFQASFPLSFTLIDAVQSATPVGVEPDYIDVLGRNLHAVQVSESSGNYNATVLIEGTLDGESWAEVQTITATGIHQIAGLFQSLRASITAYTAGTITVTAITQRS